MKRLTKFRVPMLFACALLLSLTATAQKKTEVLASPRDSVSGVVAGSHISINYGSPSVRARKIWGGLVPYNKMWRTGANPATVFKTTKDIKVEGKNLHAGKYSLFTIPGEKEWKIVFNSETGQWGIKDDGSANANPAKNVLTVTVKPMKANAFSERMKFKIDKGFVLIWEKLAVPVKIN